jgi:hypothetical protein
LGTYEAVITSKYKDGSEADKFTSFIKVAQAVGNLNITKFYDKDGNGVRNSGESGLSGWSFKVGKEGEGLLKYEGDATNENGVLFIPDLEVGTYIVEEIPQTAWYGKGPTRKSVKIVQDKTTPIEFANIRGGNLKIINFADLNNNRVMDGSDYSVERWSFKITGDGFNQNVTTEADGTVSISLKPGQYTVTESPRDCWTSTNPVSLPVTIRPEETTPALFGNLPGAELNAVVYEDKNGNGVHDLGEGISGFTLTFSGPQGQKQVLSKSDGSAGIAGIPGNYSVAAKSPAGWKLTPEAAQTVSMNPCDKKTVYFGVELVGGTIKIDKFLDTNKNKVQDQGEKGLQDWKFEIVNIGTYTTGPDGVVVVKVKPGSYTIKEIKKAGWVPTTLDSYTKSIASGESWNALFGNFPHQSLLIFNFEDKNKNGKHDAAEQGLKNWAVTVTDPMGNRRQLTTNATGIATMDLMPETDYIVTASSVGLWINTTPIQVRRNTGSDAGTIRVEFGQYLPPLPTIRILTFNDTGNIGIKDPGENGLPGWMFKITGPIGSQNFTIGNNSWYNYSTTLPGSYVIEEVIQNGWVNSTATHIIANIKRGGADQILYFGNYKPIPTVVIQTPSKGTIPGTRPCIGCEKEPKPMVTRNQDLSVIKSIEPQVLDVGEINRDCGNVIKYNITLCPEKKMVPTDLVVLVDTSGSFWELSGQARYDIIDGIIGFAASERTVGSRNLRTGLVTFDEIGKTLVPITDDLNSLIEGANNISFNSENKTIFSVGMDAAMKAFGGAAQSVGSEKVIVLITDAKGGQKSSLSNLLRPEYRVHAVVVRGHEEKPIMDMLVNLTASHQGMVTEVNGSAQITDTLNIASQIATRGRLSGVKFVDTLPSYLRLDNNSLSKNASVRLNHDGNSWSTTTITWGVGDLDICKSITFDAVFCWKLPADVNQVAGAPLPVSEVTYTNITNGIGKLAIPEGEIRIGSEAKPTPVPETATKQQPGFEAWFAAMGLLAAIYQRMRR